jgi:hypothetical protein
VLKQSLFRQTYTQQKKSQKALENGGISINNTLNKHLSGHCQSVIKLNTNFVSTHTQPKGVFFVKKES